MELRELQCRWTCVYIDVTVSLIVIDLVPRTKSLALSQEADTPLELF